ncbi:MAG: hypothetical protein NZ901_01065 [Geminocystis sp.]|nr:hypothetical protein [Geminocystis sp.]HIK36494.1 hypothetical protein [Geminocystis sp. M7585_C2015_104]MCS7146758.1 hypothetical protein [Geminocystis sp.]MCX8077092.1 hypothetical protein [Geminocystis sp.]MDW8115584.1 hypothetical protein [Geminocystis sp.]
MRKRLHGCGLSGKISRNTDGHGLNALGYYFTEKATRDICRALEGIKKTNKDKKTMPPYNPVSFVRWIAQPEKELPFLKQVDGLA